MNVPGPSGGPIVPWVRGNPQIVEGRSALDLDSTQHGEAGYHIGELAR